MRCFTKLKIRHHMEFADSHAHLYQTSFDVDIEKVVDRAKANNVKHIFLPNIDLTTIERMEKLCQTWPEIFHPMLGLHPSSVKDDFEDQLKKMEKYWKGGNYCAVGETGMDFYHDLTYTEQQEASLEKHIEWSDRYRLPLVLHTRSCNEEVYALIKRKNPSHRGVFHCFSGSFEFAKRIIDLGFYIGIGGVVTFKNSGLKEVVQKLPLEFMLLETDAPYLAPHPYRGRRNESAYIADIAKVVADLKGKSVEKVAEFTTNNAFQLYRTNNEYTFPSLKEGQSKS